MIEKFKVNIAQAEIEDLKDRIRKVRWPNAVANSAWRFGTHIDYIKSLSKYWEQEFDWRAVESRINSFPNFTATIDNCKIHFIHIKSQQKDAIPLIITHGWPGSFLEMLKIISFLTQSTSLSFHIVIPSIIGFGFSGKLPATGVNYEFVADVWHKLMTALGYEKYGIQGGDLGAGIGIKIAQKYPEHIIGLHLNYISDSYQPYLREEKDTSKEFLHYKAYAEKWKREEGAYAIIQSTKPLSLAYGLNDSPVGLCGWIIEKFHAWGDHFGNIEDSFTKDELLANVSLYWFTQTIYSSIQIYYQIKLSPLIFKENDYVNIPVGFAKFPKEIPLPPRSYIKRGLNIVHWTEMPKGGHFAALEQPELLATDIRTFFEKLK